MLRAMQAQYGSTDSAGADSIGSSGYGGGGGGSSNGGNSAGSHHACLSRQSTVCTISSIDEGVEMLMVPAAVEPLAVLTEHQPTAINTANLFVSPQASPASSSTVSTLVGHVGGSSSSKSWYVGCVCM
jgi:hypothetical protein